MADHTRNFGSSLPTRTDRVGTFYTEVGQFKDDIKQRLTLDHYMDDVLTDGAANQDGRHRQVTMKERTTPSLIADTGIVYAKEVDTKTELHYLDDSGNEVQITKDGGINVSDAVENFVQIFEEMVEITGTSGTASALSPAINTESYPSGYTVDNSMVLFTKIYNSSESAYETVSGFHYNTTDAEYQGGVVAFKTANIEVWTTSDHNAQTYSIIIGKLL